VTSASSTDIRRRLCEAHVSQHAGIGDGAAAALIYRRDIRPLLPPPAAGPVVRGHIVTQNLTFAARKPAES
jgi:hypothetical protein